MRKLVVLIAALMIVSFSSIAQNEAVITIAVPQTDEDLYRDLADEFELQNPGIRVVVDGVPFSFEDSADTIEEELEQVYRTITSADVFLVNETTLTPEITRAGYLLDLTPLISIDPTLDEFDFYPALWNSFQWDGGVWALPYQGNVTVLMYDNEIFDREGVFYPEPSWSLVDLENALRALAEYDDDGNVTQSAIFDATDTQAIFAIMVGLLGQGVYDDSFFPSVPNFNSPLLEEYVDLWAEVQKEGLVGTGDAGFDAPILVVPSFVATVPQIADGKTVVELPSGRANITADAFGVSAGTQNPDAAYQLAKFLTFSQDLAQNETDIPARQSLAEVSFAEYDPQVAEVVRNGLDNALSVADMRFTPYITDAVTDMVLQGTDVRTALDNAEIKALDQLQYASDLFGTQELIVQGPEVIELAPGEIALKFGVNSILVPLPTQEEWDRLIEDFVFDDFEVGHVSFEVEQGFFDVEIEALAEEFDCFYLPDNEVQNADLSFLLSLDPLLSTDINFDSSDYVGNVFEQVRRNDQTWALPMVVQPEVMFYNTDVFNQYGVPFPQGGWTVPEFERALRDLKITQDDPAPFIPQSLGGTYLQVLIAAYGGLAIDHRATPPVVNFADPAVVDAARQILDLAKDGYIQYDGLTENLGFNIFGSRSADVALYNRLLNPIGDLPFLGGGADREVNKLITFPQGAQLNAVSFDMGTVYISASTLYPDACYRFISAMSNTPELFNEMPARRSQIKDPALAERQGTDAAAFYQALDVLMQQPSTILIPTPLGAGLEGANIFLATIWMNRAFDRYVFDDADLELELQDAQQFASEFLLCAESIPPVNPAEDDFENYIEQVITCATDVDPTFGDLLGI